MSVEVKYNGNTIQTLSAGKGVTLSTANKFMQSDISVTADNETTIDYNGSEIKTLSAGQTGVLNCSGKLMLGDVVITVSSDPGGTTYIVFGWWEINGLLEARTLLLENVTFSVKIGDAEYTFNSIKFANNCLYYGDETVYQNGSWVFDERYKYINFQSEREVTQRFYRWMNDFARKIDNPPVDDEL